MSALTVNRRRQLRVRSGKGKGQTVGKKTAEITEDVERDPEACAAILKFRGLIYLTNSRH